jgi:hypothetical protein
VHPKLEPASQVHLIEVARADVFERAANAGRVHFGRFELGERRHFDAARATGFSEQCCEFSNARGVVADDAYAGGVDDGHGRVANPVRLGDVRFGASKPVPSALQVSTRLVGQEPDPTRHDMQRRTTRPMEVGVRIEGARMRDGVTRQIGDLPLLPPK